MASNTIKTVVATSPSKVAQKYWNALSTDSRAKLISGISEALNNNTEKVGRSALRTSHRFNGIQSSDTDTSRSKDTPTEDDDEDVIVLSSDSEAEANGEVQSEDENSTVNTDSESEEEGDEEAGESAREGAKQVGVVDDSKGSKFTSASGDVEISDSDGEEWEEEVDDADVITLDDDDDDEEASVVEQSSSLMICYRCPTKRSGRFNDRTQFLFHVKRHTFGENFSCPTCKQPFLSLNLCVAHEIRKHGKELDPNCYDEDDPSISAAKEYLQKKQLTIKGQESPSTSQTNTGTSIAPASSEIEKTDDVVDDGHIVTSTSFLPYQGPSVSHILECYEIQLNHSRPKSHRANYVADIAIRTHQSNVEQGHDVYRLGRFSKLSKPASNNHTKKVPKKSHRAAGKQSGTTGTMDDSSDPRRTTPKKKQVRANGAFVTTSSSPISSPARAVYPPSALEDDDDNFEDLFTPIPSSSKRKRKERECTPEHQVQPQDPSSPLSRLNGLVRRVCCLCSYSWTTDADLRTHRDAVHPNAKLLDLIAGTKKSSPIVKKVTFVDPCFASPPKKKQRSRNVRNKTTVKSTNKGKSPYSRKSSKTRKLRSKPDRIPAPIPDYSFTEKENFLYALGLSNRFRLDLHWKKPLDDIMPECIVLVEKMSEYDFFYYSSKSQPAVEASQAGFHFLLGF